MLQMLPEMIGAEELFRLVAFAEFVHVIEMFWSRFPISRIREFFTTVTTDIGCSGAGRWRMKSSMDTRKGRTRPRMSAEMQRVLMAFCFVLVFETIWTVLANVLLLEFVYSALVSVALISMAG
jgi:hypothetical protein